MHEGDCYYVEVTGYQDGYFFLYVWNHRDGGTFLYPGQEFNDANTIKKNQKITVPAGDPWCLEDSFPGEENVYLLFSEKDIRLKRLSDIDTKLNQTAGTEQLKLEKHLIRNFKIAERTTYIVQ